MEDQKPQTDEKGFNDDELKDIMDEIENLEKEFSDDSSASSEDVVVDETEVEAEEADVEMAEAEDVAEPVAEEEDVSLQDQVDNEIEEAVQQVQNQVEEAEAVDDMPEESHGEVVAMGSREPGEMSFSGKGKMQFHMDFPLGQESASVSVGADGMVIHFKGVELKLHESDGISFETAEGVSVCVPVSASGAHKKAA